VDLLIGNAVIIQARLQILDLGGSARHSKTH
jgi:hypothetical protein